MYTSYDASAYKFTIVPFFRILLKIIPCTVHKYCPRTNLIINHYRTLAQSSFQRSFPKDRSLIEKGTCFLLEIGNASTERETRKAHFSRIGKKADPRVRDPPARSCCVPHRPNLPTRRCLPYRPGVSSKRVWNGPSLPSFPPSPVGTGFARGVHGANTSLGGDLNFTANSGSSSSFSPPPSPFFS